MNWNQYNQEAVDPSDQRAVYFPGRDTPAFFPKECIERQCTGLNVSEVRHTGQVSASGELNNGQFVLDSFLPNYESPLVKDLSVALLTSLGKCASGPGICPQSKNFANCWRFDENPVTPLDEVLNP